MSKRNIYLIILCCLLNTAACYADSAISYDKKLSISGLSAKVIVRRDARSIPYIKASNAADLYFAQGFVTARDRLWQMDLMRRVARGRLAEIFGKAVLPEDKRWRRYGFSQIAEAGLKVMDKSLRKALNDYSRGVNAYIATLNKKTFPIEFRILKYDPEPWHPTDTIVIGKILADGLSTTWFQDLERVRLKRLSPAKFEAMTKNVTPDDVVLFGKDRVGKRVTEPSRTFDAIDSDPGLLNALNQEKKIRKESLNRIGFYAERLAASNNWVISGKRTSDGKAMLANDPHLRASAPGIWYLTHLTAPGLRVSGVTFPGVPGIVLGHNQYIAWGATNVGPDVQDVYLEEFRDSGEYKTPDGWERPSIRKEEIKFRPNPIFPKTESEFIEVVETRNGVVFRENNGKKYSLKWTARSPENQEFEAFFSLNHAKNWSEFKNSLRSYGGAAQNFVYADTYGNIGWHVGGKIPIRRKGNGALPYNGSTKDGDWVGYIPFSELPNLYNPPSGFIVTANQRIAGTGYKYQQITRQIAAPWRARRIVDLLRKNGKITMDYVGKIQHDTYNIPLAKFASFIVKEKAAAPNIVAILKNWNGRMTADSYAATVANAINACVGQKVAAGSKPASSWKIRQTILPWAIPAGDKLWLPKEYSTWAALIRSCQDGPKIDNMTTAERLGKDRTKWLWGSFRTASFSHPLARVPFIGGQFKASFKNVDGSGQTPNVGASVSMRMIVSPGAWDKTRHVIPLGQSGDPKSPNWKDQFESWRTGKSTEFAFTEEAVVRNAKETVMLEPK